MAPIQFGFFMPADQLDKARRSTYVADLDRALTLNSGHFDAAWIIDHRQFGDADVLESFTTQAYMAARHQTQNVAPDRPSRRLVECLVHEFGRLSPHGGRV